MVFGLPYIISISLKLHIQVELGKDLVKCQTIGFSARIIKLKHCYSNRSSKTWKLPCRPVVFSRIFSIFFLLAVLIQYLSCPVQNWLFLQTAQSLFILMFVFPCLRHPTCLFSRVVSGREGVFSRWEELCPRQVLQFSQWFFSSLEHETSEGDSGESHWTAF